MALAGRALYDEQAERSALRRDVHSTHVAQIPGGETPFVLHVVPDGCVDVLWGPTGSLRVAGPDTQFRTVALAAGSIAAVRFRAGHASPLLGIPVSELTDQRVLLADLWGEEADCLAERLAAASSPEEAVAELRAALFRRLPDAAPPDRLVHAVIARMRRSPRVHVADLGARLGISDRQLRRRFLTEVGYGPKTLQRILRMREVLRLSGQPGRQKGMAELADAAGYVDQAHMTNEFVRLAGMTPTAAIRCTRAASSAR